MQRTLVDRASQGDCDAFDALARRVGDQCMAIAWRILRDSDLADEAVQTALIRAWRELPRLRNPDRFEAWLHRILTNACYDEARRRRRSTDLGGGTFPESDDRDGIRTADDRDQLERALRRLTLEQRAVLVFHHYLDLPVPEVADRLGIPAGTVKSRLHYAMTALRSSLEADARTPSIREERLA